MDLKQLWQTTIEYALFLVVGFIVLFQDLGFQGLKRKLTRSEDPGKALVAKALKDAGNRNGKVAIVTGANSGIGLEMSRMLASIGYKVILGCRSEANAKEAMATIKAKNESQGLPADLEFVQIDVSRVDSVKKFAETIKSKNYNVNLLINNAGIMFMPKQITAEGLEAHFAVNFLGPFTLSLLLAETLNKNGPSRIINVSSGTASWSTGIDLGNLNAEKSFHRWWAYCDTKLMMTTISLEMSRRFADRGFKNLTVTVGHPGSIVTSITRNAGILMHLHDLAVGPISLTAEEGAFSSIWTALAPEFNGKTGLYFDKCNIVAPPTIAQDKEMAAKLWTKAKGIAKIDDIITW